MACFPEEVSPRYLVGTTKLSGVGPTLTKARRIVQLDPEWLLRDEHQARKRINRSTQTGQTYSYSVHCTDSVAESMIFDRQNRRENLMKLALDATNTDLQVDNVQRGKGEYNEMKDLRIDAAETTAQKFTRELLAYHRRFKKGFVEAATKRLPGAFFERSSSQIASL